VRSERFVKMLWFPWTIDAGASVSSLPYVESHHEELVIMEQQLFNVGLLLLKICIISYLFELLFVNACEFCLPVPYCSIKREPEESDVNSNKLG